MSAPPDNLLKVGADAMREARYADAISALETFCKGAIDRRSKPFFQAQMALVQAYQHTGQELHAIALCDQLVKANVPQVQQWAKAARIRLVEGPAQAEKRAKAAPEPAPLPASQPVPESAPESESPIAADRPSFLQVIALLPPEEATDLFDRGRKAMQQGKHEEGIAALEAFVQGADSSYSNFNWALTSLGKAYRNTQQFDKATALQQALSQSEQESLRAWARDFLKTLPKVDLPPEPEPSPAENPAATAEANPTLLEARPLVPQPLSRRSASSPSGARAVGSQASATRSARSSRSVASSGQEDLSPQILSALAHGSISWLASILLALIFMDSITAQVLGLLRFVIPIVIWRTAQHPIVKENAKEAVNYILSCLLLGVAVGLGSILAIPLLIVIWPLAILLAIAFLIYGLALTIWPIVGTILCARDCDRIFRYPNWLILHLL